MLSEYQLSVLFLDDVRIFLIFALLISIAYFYASKSILASLHGMLIIAAFLYAAIVSGHTDYGISAEYYWPLNILLLLALASAVYSIREFPGKRWVHLSHLGTCLSGVMIWFVGAMAISHDWI
ncbi:hypothetical protein ABFY09_03240 [Marinomonas sp. 5E14-1]|uniref:hypothetical protein n=1 Tax=Marinomonas sp. 5E14-1 TaxID=3153922 RepID=UPI003265A646